MLSVPDVTARSLIPPVDVHENAWMYVLAISDQPMTVRPSGEKPCPDAPYPRRPPPYVNAPPDCDQAPPTTTTEPSADTSSPSYGVIASIPPAAVQRNAW
jgi:hypothetical protein